MHFLRETLEELAARGKLRDIDPTIGAFGLQGMVLWLSRWFRPDGRLSAEEVVDQTTELALSGLLSQLKSGLQSVFAEDVGYQVGAPALGFACFLVDSKVPCRKIRVEDLLDANDDIHWEIAALQIRS